MFDFPKFLPDLYYWYLSTVALQRAIQITQYQTHTHQTGNYTDYLLAYGWLLEPSTIWNLRSQEKFKIMKPVYETRRLESLAAAYLMVVVVDEIQTIEFSLWPNRNRLFLRLGHREEIYCYFWGHDVWYFWHVNSCKGTKCFVSLNNLGLWTLLLKIRPNSYSMPWAVCLEISMSVSNGNFDSSTCMCLYNEDPSHHCVTIASWGLLTHPINSKILTCLLYKKENIQLQVGIWWNSLLFVGKVVYNIPCFPKNTDFILESL